MKTKDRSRKKSAKRLQAYELSRVRRVELLAVRKETAELGMTCGAVFKAEEGKESKIEGLGTSTAQDTVLVIYFNWSEERLRCKWPTISGVDCPKASHPTCEDP